MLCVADAMTDLLVDANVAERERFTTVYSGMEINDYLQADQHRDKIRQKFGFAKGDIVVGNRSNVFGLPHGLWQHMRFAGRSGYALVL